MSGVNDLLYEWLRDGDCYEGGITAGKEVLGGELQEVARTAWHPVSEPPTEYGIEHEMVLIWHPPTESMEWCAWDAVEGIYGKNPHYEGAVWARWRDVILMPPQGGE